MELRYFGGLTVDEIAELLAVSRITVMRDWSFARAWLKRELSGQAEDAEGRVTPLRFGGPKCEGGQ